VFTSHFASPLTQTMFEMWNGEDPEAADFVEVSDVLCKLIEEADRDAMVYIGKIFEIT
jgi:hypothetical protein